MELINTQEYSLSQLFTTKNRKIVIPDFQRDYCWGDQTHGEKHNIDIVSSFIDTLIDEFNENNNVDVILGKIDVYEYPNNFINLTDGQQRITTLYLLLGMLYKFESKSDTKNLIKNCLCSEVNEPYLQYAVRESTIFFLNDLVNEFFFNGQNLTAVEIINQPWYFSEYNLDPSIHSMLSALQTIEKRKKQLTVKGFSNFLINHIKIQYYDVQEKKHGEERFVIINTTGKSLTTSENLKPILLASNQNKLFAEQWEIRETFFWKNRNIKEIIADDGVNDFLSWCFKIIDKQDDIDIIRKAKVLYKSKSIDFNTEYYLKQIQKIFNSLEKLVEYCQEDDFKRLFNQINDNKDISNLSDIRNLSYEKLYNVILPLLAFITKFEDDKINSLKFLRRLRKNYFDLKWLDRNSNYVDWRYVLQIIEKSNTTQQVFNFNENKITLTPIQNVKLNQWFNIEEQLKVRLTEHSLKIEEWEDHEDFMGDLSFLFKVQNIKNDENIIPNLDLDSSVDFDKLKMVFNNYKATIDLISSTNSAINNIKLSNMFRLFRLYIGCNSVGHIYRASWDFEGVLFSTLNREHLFKLEYMKLLKSNDLLSYATNFIKNKIKENDIFNLQQFSAEKLINAWLTLKVFYANHKDVLLNFYDGNETGVSAYVKQNDNRLLDDQDFSIENSICGFAVRSGFGGGNYVHYTNEGLWCKSDIIDTPFSDIDYSKENRTVQQLHKNKNTIEFIINTLINA